MVPSLGRGGAERILTLLAAAWVERGHRVTVASFAQPDDVSSWQLDPRVTERRLGLLRVRRSWLDAIRLTLWRIRVVRATVRDVRPDAVISFMDRTNVLVLASTIGLRTPVIATEHNDPRHERVLRVWDLARRLLYRRARRIVVLTDGVTSYFAPALRRRIRVIPNPIVRPLAGAGIGDALGDVAIDPEHTIVAMGRLVHQKGFDLLIDAVALLAADHPSLRLVIWGEGPDRAKLEARRGALGLEGRVLLPGLTHDPAAALTVGRIFVLSSRWEGFPTVLGEAMALGRTVVTVDCPSGPSAIVRPDVDALLVSPGDPAILAAAIARVLDHPALAASLAARAVEVVERFGLETILHRWDELLDEAAIPGDEGSSLPRALMSGPADP